MREWTVIVREMQKVVISSDSKVMYHGDFSSNDRDEQTNWVEWNKQRDKLLGIESPQKGPAPDRPDMGGETGSAKPDTLKDKSGRDN